MSDDFFADLLPMKPKVEDNSETLSGAKIPFDQDAALVSGLDNQEIHEVSEAPREHQRKHEVNATQIITMGIPLSFSHFFNPKYLQHLQNTQLPRLIGHLTNSISLLSA
jgi:hypothetical protein